LLASNVWAGTQSDADSQRFAALGVPPQRLRVVGNIKFDRHVPADIPQRAAALRLDFGASRPVWVAGSTHAGEETIVLEAHQRLLKLLPSAMLVLAPRHPQRFDSVAEAVREFGFACTRRSQSSTVAAPPAPVLLLDSLGELLTYYAAADVAFVGGSLVPIGGHNLLEPASLGVAVLSGPFQFNSPQVARALADVGALSLVRNALELSQALQRLLNEPQARAAQAAAGRAAIDANRGALDRVLDLMDSIEARAR